MPVFLEAKLKKQADKLASKGKLRGDKDGYVYGALNNMGAMRGNKTTAKGKRMQKKHEEKLAGKTRKMSDLA